MLFTCTTASPPTSICSACARRGLRRDFWDLYAIAQAGLPLHEAIAAFLARFGKGEADAYHLIRALTYFEDAEKEPALPRGLTARRWAEIKRFFLTEAPKLLSP